MRQIQLSFLRASLVVLAAAALTPAVSAASRPEGPAPFDGSGPEPLDDDASAFDLSVSHGKANVGEEATILVTIKARDGFKCNDQYPHKVKKLKGSDGVTVPEIVAGTLKGKTILFSIPATPTALGEHTVTGEIRFSVCNEEACLIKKVPLSAKVTGK